MRALVNGSQIWEDGGTLNAEWRTDGWGDGNYAIEIQAAGVGDNNWSQAASTSRSYTLGEASQGGGQETGGDVNAQPDPASSFRHGDVIQIGNDIFVIYSGQRRLVPNPETLDALGLGRDRVDNKGFNESQLGSIPRGADIPDVGREPDGFSAFKNEVFPGTTPITPNASGGEVATEDTSCPSTPSRLSAGMIAVVSDYDPSPLRARSTAGLDSEILFLVPIRDQLSIVSGPICRDGYRWWEIGYQGRGGWSAEVGSSGRYHLIPNGLLLPGLGGNNLPNTSSDEAQNQNQPIPQALQEDEEKLRDTVNSEPQPVETGRQDSSGGEIEGQSQESPPVTYQRPDTSIPPAIETLADVVEVAPDAYDTFDDIRYVVNFAKGTASPLQLPCVVAGNLFDRNDAHDLSNELEAFDFGCTWVTAATPLGLVRVLLRPERYVDVWLDDVNDFFWSMPMTCALFRDVCR